MVMAASPLSDSPLAVCDASSETESSISSMTNHFSMGQMSTNHHLLSSKSESVYNSERFSSVTCFDRDLDMLDDVTLTESPSIEFFEQFPSRVHRQEALPESRPVPLRSVRVIRMALGHGVAERPRFVPGPLSRLRNLLEAERDESAQWQSSQARAPFPWADVDGVYDRQSGSCASTRAPSECSRLSESDERDSELSDRVHS